MPTIKRPRMTVQALLAYDRLHTANNEVFSSLPTDLQELSYSETQKDSRLAEKNRRSNRSSTPLSPSQSLTPLEAYGLLTDPSHPQSSTLTSILCYSPHLQSGRRPAPPRARSATENGYKPIIPPT
ncbi:hypothetical protein MMC31_000870 [Peltigera leucophlebia]|nr:hypothetical protein [Peltigera leucophlebia]